MPSEATTSPRRAAYLRAAAPWREELAELRRIVLTCGLAEEEKWGAPCFTVEGRNVAILGALKDSCCLSFPKGALLSDPDGILERPGPNTRSARLIRFTDVGAILRSEAVLAAFVHEAAELERAGATVDLAHDRDDLPLPDELRARLRDDPALAAAWDALTPGRRRGYLLHFAGAARSATRTARVDRHAPRILAGKGMHDR